jgi:hypothetical protein
MERFTGWNVTALVEGRLPGKAEVYAARLFCHAPEVDGAAIIESPTPLPVGSFVPCGVPARSGFDLLLRPASGSNA